jgi:hypothetical protein
MSLIIIRIDRHNIQQGHEKKNYFLKYILGFRFQVRREAVNFKSNWSKLNNFIQPGSSDKPVDVIRSCIALSYPFER